MQISTGLTNPVATPVTFFVFCHDKLDMLRVQLEIISLYPIPNRVQVVYSGSAPLDMDYIPVPPVKDWTHAVPTKVCLSLQWARRNFVKYACFLNADDHILSHGIITECYHKVRMWQLVGYSWLGLRRKEDITLNNLWIQCERFSHVEVQKWLRSYETRGVIHCEEELYRILRPTSYHHLEEREKETGIGTALNDESDNNRWFFKGWGLLAHHDDAARWRDFKKLQIPYLPKLLEKPHFRAWHDKNLELYG